MKKVLFLLIWMSALLSSCNNAGGGNKYVIDGTIKGSPGHTIYLELLNLTKVTVIDTAQIDANGNFRLSGAAEKGFYRLRTDENHMWNMLLENKNYKADLDYGNMQKFTIQGAPLNDDFQNGSAFILDNQKKIQKEIADFKYQQDQQAAGDILQRLATQIDQHEMSFETELRKKADNASDPLLAFYFGLFLSPEKYPVDIKKITERLQREAPTSSYTAEMVARYTASLQKNRTEEMTRKAEEASGIPIGADAPELVLTSPAGKTLKLSDLRGKVVLLDFWASWCRPCRMENPNVVAAYKKFKDKGFTIYSVSLDQKEEDWKNAIKADDLSWPNHVSDLKGWKSEAAGIYGVSSIPAQYLLDKDGKVIAKNLRGDMLERKLTEVLKGDS